MIKVILLKSLFILINSNCDFTTYQDSVVQQTNPLIVFNLQVNSQSIYGIGMWSNYMAYKLFSASDKYVQNPYDESLSNDGNLLMSIKRSTEDQYYFALYQTTILSDSVNHQAKLLRNQQLLTINILLDSTYYEGYWIFTYIATDPTTNKLQILTYGPRQSLIGKGITYPAVKFDGKLTVTFGGTGKINFSIVNQSINLRGFSGKFSKLVLLNGFYPNGAGLDDELVSKQCKVVSQCQYMIRQSIISSVMVFDGFQELHTFKEYIGVNYMIKFWLKLDYSKIVQDTKMLVMRATTNKNYQDNQDYGDRAFYLIYFIDFPYNTSTLRASTYHYAQPTLQYLGTGNASIDSYLTLTSKLTQEAQAWHHITYNQEVDQVNKQKLEAVYSSITSKVTLILDDENEFRQFTNTIMYFHIGVDEYHSSMRLQGSMAKLEFLNCVPINYSEFPVCHETCAGRCPGPTQNDCWGCYSKQNRYLVQETQSCECLSGYVDNGNDFICKKFSEQFGVVKLQQIIINQDIDKSYQQCQIGDISDYRILCLECLDNYKKWLSNPICKSDFIRLENNNISPYYIQVRDQLKYEIFYFDQNNNLNLCEGCLELCDKLQENCYQSQIQNYQGNYLIIKCKPNFYYQDNKCHYSISNCILTSSNGDCLQCDSKYYYSNNSCIECPLECQECQYNFNTQQIDCISCYKNQSLFQGKCYNCGQDCIICEWDSYEHNGSIYYLNRCLKCVNDSLYFISFDAVNCLANEIPNCLYAFHFLKNSRFITTLEYKFTPRPLDSTVMQGCAQCQYYYLYVLSNTQNECIAQNQQICHQSFFDPVVGQLINIAGDMIYGCENPIESYGYCVDDYIPLQHCRYCVYSYTHKRRKCSLCDVGYYPERLNGICHKCNISNCRLCVEQMIVSKDSAIWQKRAFYEYFVNFNGDRSFEEYAQSQNSDDYEVVCQLCLYGYELVNGKCYEACPKNCDSCQFVNDQFQCTSCLTTPKGQGLSLYQGKCIQCPFNCALCKPRTQEDIQVINPYFTNQDFLYYSNLCLLQYDGLKKLYFDSQFGIFINCPTAEQACYNQWKISRKIICSDDEYSQVIDGLVDEEAKQKYKLQNVRLSQLFQSKLDSHIPEIENNKVYKIANDGQIRELLLEYIFDNQENCIIEEMSFYHQLFSQNIFTLTNVTVIIRGQNQINSLTIKNNLDFYNFSNVQFYNITFNFGGDSTKTIKFTNTLPVSIIIQNCQFIQQTNSNYQLSFINAGNITFSDVLFNTHFESTISESFITISQQSNYNIQTQLKNIVIKGSFQNSQILTYNSKVRLLFENISIQSNFLNSILMELSDISLSINNLTFSQSEIVDCQNLINILKVSDSMIQNSIFSHLKIDNSQFLLVNQLHQLQNVRIENNIFEGESQFFILSSSNQYATNIKINSIIIQNNLFQSLSSLMQIYNQQGDWQHQLYIEKISILNNSKIYKESLYYEPLIFINITLVIIDNILISRGSSITEFQFIETSSLSINNLRAYLSEQFYSQTLHSHQDCIRRNKYIYQYWTMIDLNSIKNIYFSNFILSDLIIIDQPLIHYQNQISIYQTTTYYIFLQNWEVQRIILLSLDVPDKSSILLIDSSLKIQIQFKQLTYYNNHLHVYHSQKSQISSLIFSIYCKECSINISLLQLYQNLVTNSTSSLVNLDLKNLNFDQSSIEDNNIMKSILIIKNLYPGFQENTVTLSQVIQLFPIKSQTLFYLSIESMRVQNITLQRNYGELGGCFYINSYNQGQLFIENLQVNSLTKGGCIYIDSSQSNLDLTIKNSYFKDIYNVNLGGIIYVKPSSNKILINLMNSQILNSKSLTGSIIYTQQLQTNVKQQIIIMDVNFQQHIDSINNFLKLLSEFSDAVINTFLSGRYLIDITNINLIIEELVLENLYFDNVFLIRNSPILISKLKLINSKGIDKIFDILNDQKQPQFNLDQFLIINITDVIDNIQNVKCLESNQNYVIQMMCNIQQLGMIKVIDDQELNDFGKCRFQSIFNKISNSFWISIIEQTNINQINILNGLISQNNCTNCQNGLIFIAFVNQNISIYLKKLQIYNNYCGSQGCIKLKLIQNNPSSRILQQQQLDQIKDNIKIKVNNLNCANNIAIQGVCLNIQQANVLIENSLFVNNQATSNAGAIYISDNSSLILLIQNQFIGNQAPQNQSQSIFQKDSQFDIKILQQNIINTDKKGNQIIQAPYKLITIYGNNQKIQSKRLFQNESITIDEINYNQLKTNNNQSKQQLFITLPGGVPISDYRIFNYLSQTYDNPNITLKLQAQDQFNQKQNVANSICQIKSRQILINESQDLNIDFLDENYVNLKSITFQQDYYSLNQMIIYFNPFIPQDQILQIQFYCNSILTPIHSENNQYQAYSYHSNYYYRINIRTLPCQIGEVINEDTPYCKQCDYSQKFYSVVKNASECQLQNNDFINSITQNNFELKKGYWRQDYSNILIDPCINNMDNCLGGWDYDYRSCFEGHIGALCEECDIYNIRGQGQYATSEKYSCGRCASIERNLVIIIGISTWTLISTILTVKSTYEFSLDVKRNWRLKSTALIIANEDFKSGILIKFISNYFLIIGSLSQFQLQIPKFTYSLLAATSNPIQTMVYSLDCFLVNSIQIDIVYSRMLWQLLTPMIYLLIFLLASQLVLRKFAITQAMQIKMTGILYLFIFFQPNLIGGLISIISYRYVDGFKWIQGQMAYKYDDPTHLSLIPYFILVIGIIGIIIPLFIMKKLYNNRKLFKKYIINHIYAYLNNEYIQEAYFWELLKLLVKDFIILILIFYQDYIFMKASLIYLILYLQLYLTKKYKPYRLAQFNKLDENMLTICQISMVLGFALFQSFSQNIKEPQISFILLLATINVAYSLNLLKQLIDAYTIKFQVYIDNIKEFIKQKFPNVSRMPFCINLLKNKTEASKRSKKNFRKLLHSIQQSQSIKTQIITTERKE